VSKAEKTLAKVMSGRQDTNVSFAELCQVLTRLGFRLRIEGSHHNFRRDGFEAINLQPHGSDAKPYQVKQVRAVLKKGGY
jgi:predicted RNA binding protein YcfA (HicA-like mRNA interferase family)